MCADFKKRKKHTKTIYQIIAEKCGSTPSHVGKIARGEKTPKFGKKGLEIKKALEEFLGGNND